MWNVILVLRMFGVREQTNTHETISEEYETKFHRTSEGNSLQGRLFGCVLTLGLWERYCEAQPRSHIPFRTETLIPPAARSGGWCLAAGPLSSNIPAGDCPHSRSVTPLSQGQPISYGWLMLEWVDGGGVWRPRPHTSILDHSEGSF